ncbi:hypothetical protein ACOXXX_19425 [Thalassococcus sp. BH17M4-6]|uniref:hypothetical protein n=1 Tax=Thalassococcus sp. BH17M4-6 TaxID=3413148 RepID=UPI003BE57EF2
MMPPPEIPGRKALFVERRTYRRRRLMDAARLLPLLLMLLWAVPLLWPKGSEAGVSSSGALTYLFAVWLGMIALACLISLALGGRDRDDPPGPGA